MSSKEETLQTLQVELSEKLEALKTQGLDEADQQIATTALLLEFGASQASSRNIGILNDS